MKPNGRTTQPGQLPDQIPSLKPSSTGSLLARKVANCEAILVWFQTRPSQLQQLLGGAFTLSLLQGIYDIVLEDYIQETSQYL